MRNNSSVCRTLPWLLAAVVAVTLPGVYSAPVRPTPPPQTIIDIDDQSPETKADLAEKTRLKDQSPVTKANLDMEKLEESQPSRSKTKANPDVEKLEESQPSKSKYTPAEKTLEKSLPSGLTLTKADCPQTAKILTVAVFKHPEMAVSLTKAALQARTPPKGQGRLSCECLTRIVRAGVRAAPRQASDIVQMALSMHSECADELNALLKDGEVRDGKDGAGSNDNNGYGLGPDGYNTPNDYYGQFGIGFGPGFPGSPGFVGSPPSGAIALPPAPNPVTNVVNG